MVEGCLGSDGFQELKFYIIGKREGKRKPAEGILELREKQILRNVDLGEDLLENGNKQEDTQGSLYLM